MMKNKPFVLLSLLSLLSVLALVSCQSPVAITAKAAAGSGRVAVAVKTPSRTVVADAAGAVTNYVVTLTSHDGWEPINADIEAGAGAASFDPVPAGTWDVDVTAYAGAAVIGLGTLNNLAVADGDSLELTVPITTTQAGTGSFSFAFSLPAAAAVNAVSAQLYTAAGDMAADQPTVSELTWGAAETTGTVAAYDLPSGAYRLKLTYRRGGDAGAVVKVDTEAVNVFDNLTSDLWLDPAGMLQDHKAYALGDFKEAAVGTTTALRGWVGASDSYVSVLVNGPLDTTYAVYQNIFSIYPAAGTVRHPIVQYDSNHQILRHIDIPDIEVQDLAVDADGNLFVAGDFYLDNMVPTLSIGTDSNGNDVSFTGYTGYHPLLVKLNPEGQIVWAKSASVSDGAANAGFNAVKVFGSGASQAVDVVGYSMQASAYDFGNNVQAPAPQSENALLVQYNADGQALWARTQATDLSTSSSYFQSLGLDGAGNIYVGGELSGQDTYTFAGSGMDTPITVTMTSTVPDDFGNDFVVSSLVLVKYSPTGTPLWAQTTVTTTGNSINKVAVDAGGNVFATLGAWATGTTDFGTNAAGTSYSFSPVGGAPYLAKYDADGLIQWVSSVDTVGAQGYFANLVLGGQGEITVVGSVNGTTATSFTSQSVTGGYADQNALVVRYNASGSALWARAASVASNNSEYYAVAIDSVGRILAGGSQTGTGSFGYGDGITLSGDGAAYNSLFVQYQ